MKIVGSQLALKISELRKISENIRLEVDLLSKCNPNYLYKYHNKYVTYCIFLLNYSTGHRAVVDPYYSLALFDLGSQTVIIEDKFVTRRHNARLAYLSDIAVQQIKYYLNYLQNYCRLIKDSNSDLAGSIQRLLDDTLCQDIPLFFYLDENMQLIRVRPSELRKESTISSFPLNTNRHVLSHHLSLRGLPQELLDVQMGHIEAGCEPYSESSVLSPGSVAQEIIPILNAFMEDTGWVALEATVSSKGYKNPKDFGCDKDVLIGPALRARARGLRWKKDAELISRCFSEFFKDETLAKLNRDEVDHVWRQIVSDSAYTDKRYFIFYTLFLRFLRRLKAKGVKLSIPGKNMIAKTKASIFSADFNNQIALSKKCNFVFLSYLQGRSSQVPTVERRIAEILVSAVVFGALLNKSFHRQFVDKLLAGVFSVESTAFIDFELVVGQDGGPVQRWFFDPSSQALLMGLYKLEKGQKITCDKKQVYEQIDILLGEELNLSWKKKGGGVRSLLSLSVLSEQYIAYWRYRLPGSLSAYAEGRLLVASVSQKNLWRTITGLISEYYIELEEGYSSKYSVDNAEFIRVFDREKPNWKIANDIWKKIRPICSKENIKSVSRKSRMDELRTALEKVKEEINNSYDYLPPVTLVFLNWLLFLTKNPTYRGNTHIVANSIITYGSTIGRLLIETGCHLDFLNSSDSVYEDWYEEIVDLSRRKKKDYLVNRLEEFHRYLIENYAQPSIDWSEISDVEHRVSMDPGWLTEAEYSRAMDLLKNDNYIDERLRGIHCLMLFFYYRFGVRKNEVFGLTLQDVVIYRDKQLILYIRNTRYNTVKTINGIRQILILEAVSDEEMALVRHWLSHVESYSETVPDAAIFSERGLPRILIERSISVDRVVTAIRIASGDGQMRLRHMRHGFASRNYYYMSLSEDRDINNCLAEKMFSRLCSVNNPASVREKLLGTARISTRGTYAVMTVLGHGDPATTISHYTHTLDTELHRHTRGAVELPSGPALAYALQMSNDAVRAARSRRNGALNDPWLTQRYSKSLALLPYKSIRRNQKLMMPAQRNIIKNSSALSLADVDRMLAISGLLHNHDSLAERFKISESDVRALLKAARELQELSDYYDFSIDNVEQDWVDLGDRRFDKLDKESTRIRGYLHNVSRSESLYKKSLQAMEAWSKSYHPETGMLLTKKPDYFYRILSMLELLGVDSEQLVAMLPASSSVSVSHWAAIRDSLVEMGVKVKENARVAKGNYLNSESRVAIGLAKGSGHALAHQRTLNRAVFVVLCWARSGVATVFER